MLWPPHHLYKWKFCSQANTESNKRNLHLTGSIGKTKRTWYKMEHRGFSTFRLSILGQFSNNWNIPICWTIQNNFNHSTQRYLLLCPVASCLLEAVAQVFPPKPPSEHNNWTIFPSILAQSFLAGSLRATGRWADDVKCRSQLLSLLQKGEKLGANYSWTTGLIASVITCFVM